MAGVVKNRICDPSWPSAMPSRYLDALRRPSADEEHDPIVELYRAGGLYRTWESERTRLLRKAADELKDKWGTVHVLDVESYFMRYTDTAWIHWAVKEGGQPVNQLEAKCLAKKFGLLWRFVVLEKDGQTLYANFHTQQVVEIKSDAADGADGADGAVPVGAVPVGADGAVPVGAVPVGAVPVGADGAVPVGAVPVGAVPVGADGAVPVGAVPVGAVPVGADGAVPVGAVPVGAVPVGAVPVGADGADGADGAVPVGAVPVCVGRYSIPLCLGTPLFGIQDHDWIYHEDAACPSFVKHKEEIQKKVNAVTSAFLKRLFRDQMLLHELHLPLGRCLAKTKDGGSCKRQRTCYSSAYCTRHEGLGLDEYVEQGYHWIANWPRCCSNHDDDEEDDSSSINRCQFWVAHNNGFIGICGAQAVVLDTEFPVPLCEHHLKEVMGVLNCVPRLQSQE
jgi:hypothetical protein